MSNCLLQHRRLGNFLTVAVFQKHKAQVKFNIFKLNESKCAAVSQVWVSCSASASASPRASQCLPLSRVCVCVYVCLLTCVWVYRQYINYISQCSLQRKTVLAFSPCLRSLFVTCSNKELKREDRHCHRGELPLRWLDSKTCSINTTLQPSQQNCRCEKEWEQRSFCLCTGVRTVGERAKGGRAAAGGVPKICFAPWWLCSGPSLTSPQVWWRWNPVSGLFFQPHSYSWGSLSQGPLSQEWGLLRSWGARTLRGARRLGPQGEEILEKQTLKLLLFYF